MNNEFLDVALVQRIKQSRINAKRERFETPQKGRQNISLTNPKSFWTQCSFKHENFSPKQTIEFQPFGHERDQLGRLMTQSLDLFPQNTHQITSSSFYPSEIGQDKIIYKQCSQQKTPHSEQRGVLNIQKPTQPMHSEPSHLPQKPGTSFFNKRCQRSIGTPSTVDRTSTRMSTILDIPIRIKGAYYHKVRYASQPQSPTQSNSDTCIPNSQKKGKFQNLQQSNVSTFLQDQKVGYVYSPQLRKTVPLKRKFEKKHQTDFKVPNHLRQNKPFLTPSFVEDPVQGVPFCTYKEVRSYDKPTQPPQPDVKDYDYNEYQKFRYKQNPSFEIGKQLGREAASYMGAEFRVLDEVEMQKNERKYAQRQRMEKAAKEDAAKWAALKKTKFSTRTDSIDFEKDNKEAKQRFEERLNTTEVQRSEFCEAARIQIKWQKEQISKHRAI